MPNLNTWNSTTLQGRPTITISASQLQHDYHSDYSQRTIDGTHFWVLASGSHTHNSEFPHNELHEILSSGRPYS